MDLSTEDDKLVTLARMTRARIDAREGAAVRDIDGRTYVAADVNIPSVRIDAMALAVAMALSSGTKGFEAGAIVTAEPGEAIIDLSPIRDVAGTGIAVYIADEAGDVKVVQTS